MYLPIKLTLAFLVGSSLLFTGCNKDDDDVTLDLNFQVNDDLEGEWKVTSYTDDGEEYMESMIDSFTFKFTKESPAGGELERTAVLSGGSTEVATEDYEIQNEGRKIRIDGSDIDIEIDGDRLTLENIGDASTVVIEAERK